MHPNFRLVLLANRPGYPFLGNHFLQVLGETFSAHSVTNPDQESERTLLAQLAPEINKDLILRLVGAFHDLRKGYDAGTLNYPYSLRELINLVKHLQAYPGDSLGDALWNVFDFDVYKPETIEQLAAILAHHGLASHAPHLGLAAAREAAKKKIQDAKFEPKNTELGEPKEGDHDDKEHSGGNKWAGGLHTQDPIRLPALPAPAARAPLLLLPRARAPAPAPIFLAGAATTAPAPAPEAFLTTAHLASFRKDDTICVRRPSYPSSTSPSIHPTHAVAFPVAPHRYAPAPTPTPTYTSMLSPQMPPGMPPIVRSVSSPPAPVSVRTSPTARGKPRSRGKRRSPLKGLFSFSLSLSSASSHSAASITQTPSPIRVPLPPLVSVDGDAPEEEDEDAWVDVDDEDDSEGEGDGEMTVVDDREWEGGGGRRAADAHTLALQAACASCAASA
ncbi:hypothetical protein B0H14DRAFT_3716919 [Mycena olivaceomarginata]|nr:hypothetical protein B0H14DRAFT_3716919 [Mycena olivaceomarginata]